MSSEKPTQDECYKFWESNTEICRAGCVVDGPEECEILKKYLKEQEALK